MTEEELIKKCSEIAFDAKTNWDAREEILKLAATAEARRDEREAPGALEWISQNASASGWDVGRFIQFVDEHNMIEELVNTLAAYEARASAAPLK